MTKDSGDGVDRGGIHDNLRVSKSENLTQVDPLALPAPGVEHETLANMQQLHPQRLISTPGHLPQPVEAGCDRTLGIDVRERDLNPFQCFDT